MKAYDDFAEICFLKKLPTFCKVITQVIRMSGRKSDAAIISQKSIKKIRDKQVNKAYLSIYDTFLCEKQYFLPIISMRGNLNQRLDKTWLLS